MSEGKVLARTVAFFYGFFTGSVVIMGIGLYALWKQQNGR